MRSSTSAIRTNPATSAAKCCYGEAHLQDLAARIRRTLDAGVELAVVD